MRSPSRHWIARGFKLDARDRAAALRALAWILAAEAAVRLVPFSTLDRWVARLPPSRSANRSMTAPECARAMDRVSRVVPRARCLARALAASCLLRRAGRLPTLNLGVGLDDDRHLDAHAWLECDGIVVTGGDTSHRYVPLSAPVSRGR